MLPRAALAAVIRTLRALKGVSQAELPADRKHLYKVEAGFSNMSLEMLVQLAQTLKVEPSTLVVLLQSADNAASPDAILEKVKSDLDEFERLGGAAECKRPANTPSEIRN